MAEPTRPSVRTQRLRTLQRAVALLVMGLATTVLVAWGCFVRARHEPFDESTLQDWFFDSRGEELHDELHRRNPHVTDTRVFIVQREEGTGYLCFRAVATSPVMFVRSTLSRRSDAASSRLWRRAKANVREIVPESLQHLVTPWFNGSRDWPDLKNDVMTTATVEQAGWPLRSAYAHSFDGPELVVTRGYLKLPLSMAMLELLQINAIVCDSLPILPLWRGLILNTLFYAVAWWGVIVLAMGTVRRGRGLVRRRRGLCGRCAYDLAGVPSESPCPECGTPRAGARPTIVG